MREFFDKCEIVRDHEDWPASAIIMSRDGDVVRRFNEDWTDDQIWEALAFANYAYELGYSRGRRDKAREMMYQDRPLY